MSDEVIIFLAGFMSMLLPIPFILGAWLEGKRREKRTEPDLDVSSSSGAARPS